MHSRPVRLLLAVIPLLLFLPLIPVANAQTNGEALCAEARDLPGNARRFNGYAIVRAPAQGGGGAQVVLGTDGDDVLEAGSGNDLLCGFGGNDVLRGGSGNDILVGGPGADRLFGESGGDTLLADADDRVVDGGTGNNRVVTEQGGVPPGPTATVTVSLSDPRPSGAINVCEITVNVTGGPPNTELFVEIDSTRGSAFSSGPETTTNDDGDVQFVAGGLPQQGQALVRVEVRENDEFGAVVGIWTGNAVCDG